jgi:hypothetical protein
MLLNKSVRSKCYFPLPPLELSKKTTLHSKPLLSYLLYYVFKTPSTNGGHFYNFSIKQ